jgi:CRP/FNR family transcriptional regulator, cyclic AMP receptor protein
MVDKQCRTSQIVPAGARSKERAWDPVRLLLGTYLFADLAPAAIGPLAARLTSRRYRRGEYVVRAGEPAVALYVLARGLVKEAVTIPDGAELVSELYRTGDVFGEPGLFSRDRTRLVSVAAIEPSDVAALEREVLIGFLQRHPPAMARMLQGLAESVRAVIHEMTNIAYRPIRERLALQLLELADLAPAPNRTITISQTTLAAMIAATRENVNRTLADLAADGYIHIHDRTIAITDPIALRLLADRALPLQPPPNHPSTP